MSVESDVKCFRQSVIYDLLATFADALRYSEEASLPALCAQFGDILAASTRD